MSTVTIKVDCSSAIGRLENIKKNLYTNTQALIVDTINEASDEATAKVNEATSAYPNNPDVSLVNNVQDLTGTVEMFGDDRLFVEYGAGDQTLPPHHKGEYSDLHDGMYKRTGYKFWKYGGETYEGIPAFRPIFNAARKAEQYLKDHKDEVFTGRGLD